MELFGTNFSLNLGGWRLRLVLALEDVEAPPSPRVHPPHRMRVVPEDEYVR